MKHFFLFLALFCYSFEAFSQGADCSTADPFCTDFVYTFPNSTNTIAEIGPEYDCLLDQPNPSWYFLQIEDAGDIG